MDVTDIAIIGASTAGRGLAKAVSLAGVNVNLVELNKDTLEKGKKLIEEEMDLLIEKWGLTTSEKKAALSRISGVTALEDIDKNCHMVIVTVREDLEMNKDIFARLDKIVNPDAILVTHTAILSITEIASATNRPDKVAGIMFIPPVIKVNLGEVIRGLKTSQETFETIESFIQNRLKKTPVEVSESPGYVTIRMLVNMLNEAMFTAMEGVSSIDDIDTAMTLGFHMKRGPFAIADKIGLDMVLVWMRHISQEVGSRSGYICPIIVKLVRAGHLGIKTGEGFYKYDEHGKIVGLGVLSQFKKWSYGQ